ncbi:CDC48 family AAA ATPase [Methylocystis bryophila]|uniref:AAA family ATPase n=1 Tax=Methylocystis bryophila TaxID=655015 RepID=A0A1W6MY16_9HYPH|nr:CDC48 family AAA ATPase [Methylocystis bryophila]ARN82426.1 AAA family ATPase [Methylocystis bryophila]BDV38608.1 ATPase AAA [Methylocystis bryophila]
MSESEGTLRLTVVEARRDDVGRGIVRLDPETLRQIGAGPGDILEIEGRTKTVAKAMPTFKEQRGQQVIQIDGVGRKNAGVALGQAATIRKVAHAIARRLSVTPLGAGALHQDEIEYMANRLDGLAVRTGDRVRIALFGGNHRDFHIKRTEPDGPVVIHPDTLLTLERPRNDSSTQTASAETEEFVTYDDLGGMEREVAKVREMIELPLSHPEIFERLGITPPKGVLLHGLPGCGKTLLGRAVAHESEAAFIYVSGPEIIQKFYGESEARLRKIFEDAQRRAPCIIFFDEIDSLAPKRERVEGEVEKRVVAQLLALMDGLKSRGDVIVMAATNRPNSLDPALRRPGRFDREIAIGIPNETARREILEIYARGMPLGDDIELSDLAATTHGFTGADLTALCREAAMAALRRQLPQLSVGSGPIPSEALMSLEVKMADFREALSEVSPSGLREVEIETPNVRWEEVGGLESIKEALKEAIVWPLSQPRIFEEIGLQPPRGILLYGPPGNGKTLIAKALASQSNLNFISIKGPELLSKYIGESEQGVRELFARARHAAPCIVFLDEVDALAPKRGFDGRSPVTDRVVSQLLTELDGVEALRDVWVIAATNRLDMIDEALLRPGRLDFHLEVKRPDQKARAAILAVHLRQKPVDEKIELAALADRTEGLSAAEVRFVCDRASMLAIRRVFKEPDAGPIELGSLRLEQRDFDEALAEQRAALEDAIAAQAALF